MAKSCAALLAALLLNCAMQDASASDQGRTAEEAALAKCPGAAKHILQGYPDLASLDVAKQAKSKAKQVELPPPTHPALRESLLEMEREDQAVRFADLQNPQAVEKLFAVDAGNLVRIKKLVATRGFPTVEMVGQDGFNAAWLLVQHADRDPAFQQQVLDVLIEERLIAGEQLALLTDRVVVAQGKPQRYGSQFTEKDGHRIPRPIEEPIEKLDDRRKAMGMMPFADYRCAMDVMYPVRGD